MHAPATIAATLSLVAAVVLAACGGAVEKGRDNQAVLDLRKVMKLNRHNSLLKSGRIEESLAEHRAIMAALAARDADASVQRMREHFSNGLEAAV